MKRFGNVTELAALSIFGRRRAWLLGVSLSLGMVLAGCGDLVPSTNTYPVDFFSEMHYQKSWDAGEPDGRNAPAGAVPVTGGEVDYTREEAAELENPFEANPELGAEVYAVNCDHCHGPEGAGDGIVGAFFEGYDGPTPANLQESDLPPGEVYWVATNGLDNMPAFGRLLTEEERWAVVEYIRTLQ